ncbi:aspartate phosphatase [Bacillus subtilis]|uniref:aspartate phosphatase n=1 Tax=Bacillus subtilis TaxID=1423 RepID=UPI0024BF318D|nr:aspartate phosphatase [Bacillus subtilis]MDK1005128.1 aspartate phosphatase [Bacillus subtilis]
MKLKHASFFILAIVLIGFVSIYLNTQKDVQEARRGHTASIGYFIEKGSFEVASRGHTS